MPFPIFYRTTHVQHICIARCMLWPSVPLSISSRCSVETVELIELIGSTEATLSPKIRALPSETLSQTL